MFSRLETEFRLPVTGDRLLIVNADDFGMTPGVCRGILRAHELGSVSSTSALVVAPSFDKFALALRESGLPTGAHLAVVGEDRPLLAAREIPSLVDHSGRFPLTWREFVRRSLRGGTDVDDLRRELSAQLDKLESVGITPTHVDSHQNLHLWPQMASVLLDLAGQRSIGAIRLCRAARWNPVGVGVRALSELLARRAIRAGLAFPDASTPLDDDANLVQGGLVEAVARMSASDVGSNELVVHLGEPDDAERARYRSRFDWVQQFDAVCSPVFRAAIDESGLRLGSFSDLVRTESVAKA